MVKKEREKGVDDGFLLVYEPYQATVGCNDNDYGCEDGCTEGQCR